MWLFIYLFRDIEFAGHVANYLDTRKLIFERQKLTLSNNGVFLLCHICVKNESTVWNCMIIKEVSAQNRHDICKLRDCNETETNDHIVHKRTLNYLAKLANLTKWLSVGLQTTWLRICVPLPSLNFWNKLKKENQILT